MKLESGKTYKSRDGRKVFIGCVLDKNPLGGKSPSGYTAFGFFDGSSIVDMWTADGLFCTTGTGCNDLVAEWREPRVVEREVLLVETRSGDFGCVLEHWACSADKILARKKVTITEGEGV
jgi:hypothetical protein